MSVQVSSTRVVIVIDPSYSGDDLGLPERCLVEYTV